LPLRPTQQERKVREPRNAEEEGDRKKKKRKTKKNA
jgi:hypothetical protein